MEIFTGIIVGITLGVFFTWYTLFVIHLIINSQGIDSLIKFIMVVLMIGLYIATVVAGLHGG